MKCRVCQQPTDEIINFGDMPIANAFISSLRQDHEFLFTLKTAFCSSCKCFQLVDQPKPEMMFHDQYPFFSSTSRSMATHFENMASNYIKNYIPNPKNAFVVELGSNDGIMLQHFAKVGISHLGIEPSQNVAAVSREKGVNAICKFFSKETAAEILKEYGPADIISSANVMCHIPDLDSVGKGVDILLKDDGILVFEDPYLGDIIAKTSYDQIYDEHIYLFSVQSVSNIFRKHGLEVFHVEPQKTHGGSMRYYLCRTNKRTIQGSVIHQLKLEEKLGLGNLETYQRFSHNCEKSRGELVTLLKRLKAEGKKVVGYAATSKSTTILNYCKIGPDLIECIYDTTPMKQGKYSPGMHIPIRSYEQFKEDKPDYAVLFAWNHAKEIFQKEKNFIENGGKWVVFVPEVKLLDPSEVVSYES